MNRCRQNQSLWIEEYDKKKIEEKLPHDGAVERSSQFLIYLNLVLSHSQKRTTTIKHMKIWNKDIVFSWCVNCNMNMWLNKSMRCENFLLPLFVNLVWAKSKAHRKKNEIKKNEDISIQKTVRYIVLFEYYRCKSHVFYWINTFTYMDN